MPYSIANLTKRSIRGDVAYALGDNWPFTTTSGGSTTTAVISSLIGVPIVSIQNKYVLMEAGSSDSEYRIASGFAPATGTITVRRAFSNSILTALAGHLHEFSPHLYTLGINAAIRELYPAVYRQILMHQFVRYQPFRVIPLPRNMERVSEIAEDRRVSAALQDFYDRSDSSTTAGSAYTASVGTWGITGESLYCVSDTDGDFLTTTANFYLQDGVAEFRVRGDTTDTASRTILFAFRVNDDLTAALGVRLINNLVVLRKLSGGSWSTLSSATVTTTEDVDYVVRVMWQGSWVSVWVDDVQYLLYELTGTDLQYLGYDESGGTFGKFGFRLEKTGSPSLSATSTRVSYALVHGLVGTEPRGSWRPSMGGRLIELNYLNRSRSAYVGRMLWVWGMSELTQLTADTTFEALASDSTAIVELQTTDPAYELFIQWAAYEVLRSASMQAHTDDPIKRQEYRERAQDQLGVAMRLRSPKAMRSYARPLVG